MVIFVTRQQIQLLLKLLIELLFMVKRPSDDR